MVNLRCENSQGILPSSPTYFSRFASFGVVLINPDTYRCASPLRAFAVESFESGNINEGNSHNPARSPFSGRRWIKYRPSLRWIAQTRVSSTRTAFLIVLMGNFLA